MNNSVSFFQKIRRVLLLVLGVSTGTQASLASNQVKPPALAERLAAVRSKLESQQNPAVTESQAPGKARVLLAQWGNQWANWNNWNNWNNWRDWNNWGNFGNWGNF